MGQRGIKAENHVPCTCTMNHVFTVLSDLARIKSQKTLSLTMFFIKEKISTTQVSIIKVIKH